MEDEMITEEYITPEEFSPGTEQMEKSVSHQN